MKAGGGGRCRGGRWHLLCVPSPNRSITLSLLPVLRASWQCLACFKHLKAVLPSEFLRPGRSVPPLPRIHPSAAHHSQLPAASRRCQRELPAMGVSSPTVARRCALGITINDLHQSSGWHGAGAARRLPHPFGCVRSPLFLPVQDAGRPHPGNPGAGRHVGGAGSLHHHAAR